MIHFNSNFKFKFLLLAAALVMNVGTMWGWKGYAKLTVKSGDSNKGLVYASTSNSTPSSYEAESSATQKGSKTGSEPKTFYAFYQAKKGYHFTSWSKSGLYSFDSDGNPCTVKVQTSTAGLTNTGTVTANFDANTYNLTAYSNNGVFGDGTTTYQIQSNNNTPLTYASANYCELSWKLPTRTGYTFVGYYDAAKDGVQVYAANGACVNNTGYWSNGAYMKDADLTVYAHWSANSYTVTFDANGGSCSTSSKDVTYDATYGTLPTPTRTGYTFNGWFTSAIGGSQVLSSSKVQITDAQKLYAQWTINQYTLTYDANGGTCSIANKKVAYNEAYGALPTPTAPTGKNFLGWFTAAAGGTEVTAETKIGTADVTIYAQYEEKLTAEYYGSDQTLYVDGTYSGFSFRYTSDAKPSLNGNFYYAITENTPSVITTGSNHTSEIIGYDPENNILTAYNAGTARIKFGQKDDGSHIANDVTYTITVSKIANALDASINVTALNPDGTATISLGGTRNNTVTDIVYNVKSQTLDANNKVLKPSDQTNVVTNSSNVFTAINAGTAKVKVSQAESYKYTEFSKEFDITISKINNTLAIKSAQTILVDGTIASVYSGKNSDATINPSISIESINAINNGDGQVISYDLGSNTITAHNAGVATLTLTQAETYKYTAAQKSIQVTVNKHDNHIYIDGTADSKSYTKSYDEGQSVALTATNTDYTGSPLTVSENSNPDIATYANGQIKTYHTAGSATWSVSQPENYKYKAATATFTVNIGNVAESTDCYVLQADEQHSYGKYGDDNSLYYKDFSFNVDAPGAVLSLNMWKYSSANDLTMRIYGYDASGNQTTIKTFDADDLNTSATNYSFNIADNIRRIRIQNGGGAWVSCSTLNYYASQIRVTRKTYLTAADVTYPSTRYPDGDAISANLVVNWSESNGGDIRILCDNPKFTLSQTTITNTSCNGGTTTIPVSYTSTLAGTDVANITIYNNVRRITCTMTATTVKRDQSVTWKSGIDQISILSTVEDPITSSTLPITSLTSSDENIIKVENGVLIPRGTGTVTLTAKNDGNEVYNAITATKQVEVTADLIQTIAWDQNLMNLQLGAANEKLLATATSDVAGCSTNGARAISYQSSNEAVVKVVNGNEIQIVGAGTATLTATQTGGTDADGHKYAAVSVEKKVVVRDPDAACVSYVYQQTSEWSHDFGWNETTDDTKTYEVEFQNGQPAAYEFDYKGEYHTVGIKYFTGKMYVDEYVNGSWNNIQSLGEPSVGTYKTASGTLNRAATKMRIRIEASTGYFYFKDLQIQLARYIEADNSSVNFDTKTSSPISKTVNIAYSNIQDNLTITSNSTLFTVNQDGVEGSCGSRGTLALQITYTPTKATNGTPDEGKIKITDGKSALEIPVSGTATVTDREIVWSQEPTATYTFQTESLSATAQTSDGYHTAAGSVYFSLTSDSQDKAAISSDNVLSFKKAGTVQVMANTVTDAKYNPATTVTKTWIVAITPTAVDALPTVDEVTYADGLTLNDITLDGGSAKNTINNAAIEGTYAWTNPATVPTLGTAEYDLTFTPSNTDMYSACTGKVSVYVNRPYEVAFTGGDNTMDNQSFKTDEQNALTANTLTKQIAVTYNEDGGADVDDDTQNASFTGWKDANGYFYTDQQTVKNLSTEGGTVTLTAQWTTEAITLPTTSKSGSIFQGWYNGETKIGDAGDSYTPTATIELTAHWDKKKITVYIGTSETEENQADWETIHKNNPNAIAITDDKDWANEHPNNVVLNEDGTYSCNTFTITDGNPLNIPVTFTANQVTYGRSSSGSWGTVCLPFELVSDGTIQYYKLKEYKNNAMYYTPIDHVEPNTPAVFKLLSGSSISMSLTNEEVVETPSTQMESTGDASTDWTLIGTYVKKTYTPSENPDKYYIASNAFWCFTQNTKQTLNLNPFRAYFQTTAQAAPGRISINIFDEMGTVTSIGELDGSGDIHTATGNFSLSGQNLGKNPNVHGLYIKNGKVVFGNK